MIMLSDTHDKERESTCNITPVKFNRKIVINCNPTYTYMVETNTHICLSALLLAVHETLITYRSLSDSHDKETENIIPAKVNQPIVINCNLTCDKLAIDL